VPLPSNYHSDVDSNADYDWLWKGGKDFDIEEFKALRNWERYLDNGIYPQIHEDGIELHEKEIPRLSIEERRLASNGDATGVDENTEANVEKTSSDSSSGSASPPSSKRKRLHTSEHDHDEPPVTRPKRTQEAAIWPRQPCDKAVTVRLCASAVSQPGRLRSQDDWRA